MVMKSSIADKKKQSAFKLIAFILPFIFLTLLELVLRLSGYGHDLSLFVVDTSHPDSYIMNKYVSARYFTNGANETIGNFEPFKIIKEKNTIRLFVLGESTTIGYPYMHNGSFHRWLTYRLNQMYPDCNFEIINLSLTAVNSYTVLDIAKELPAYKPDGILIYSGHNEYYGALGVGSTSSFSNSSWLIQALIRSKHLRIVQLLFNTIQTFNSKSKIKISQTLMERMVADQHIPYKSEKFKNGVAQFKSNIDETCRLFSARKIPVFISTLVSNEKDLRPLSSDLKEGDTSASSYYDKGLVSYGKSDTIMARYFFKRALEHDQLRFRAPEEMNLIISNATISYPGIYLVDTRKLFEKNSRGQILGNETILEHVHPNLSGYALMSEAFYSVLKSHSILPTSPEFEMSLSQLKHQMPLPAVDSLFGVYSVRELEKKWPFNYSRKEQTAPITFEERIAMAMISQHLPWNEAMDKLMTYYEKNNDPIHELKVAEAVALEYPQDMAFYAIAGKLNARQSNVSKAINYYHRAFLIQPSMDLAKALFTLELKDGHPEKAGLYVNYALTIKPDNQSLLKAQQVIRHMTELQMKRSTLTVK